MEANFPRLNAEIKLLERVLRLATRQLRGLRHVPYDERLRQLSLFSLARQRLRADLILEFKVFNSEIDLSPSDFFLRSWGLREYYGILPEGPRRFR